MAQQGVQKCPAAAGFRSLQKIQSEYGSRTEFFHEGGTISEHFRNDGYKDTQLSNNMLLYAVIYQTFEGQL